MKDLWTELARRARAANRESDAAATAPFGFEEAVLRAVRNAAPRPSSPFECWIPLLRPALGLAVGAVLVCLAVEKILAPETPDHLLAETEALFELALLK